MKHQNPRKNEKSIEQKAFIKIYHVKFEIIIDFEYENKKKKY